MNTTAVDALFRPLTVKTLTLKNRIVMAPMTRSFSPEGVPGDNVAAYYRRRAEGDVGLILSEGTVVDRPASRNDPGIPYFHGEQSLAGWKKVIDGVHEAGGRMGPQIWHVGSVPSFRDWTPDGPIESPSGLLAPGKERGLAMTEEAIADTITAFARAAADAKRLGFDTLEIHGAHGYLIDQFFWDGTNQRTDHYGGTSIKERSRFAVEVVRAVRAAVGPEFPVFLRLSQWKQQDYSVKLAKTPDEMSDWLLPLKEAGVDVFHCSQRRFWEPEFEGSDLNFAGWAKKLTGVTTVSVGSVGLSGDLLTTFQGEKSSVSGLDELVRRIEREEFDLIAVGRAILSDPQWVHKVETGDRANLRDFDPAAMATLS
jgi:2,4-dienoyl-CoA reductase-like NADH-dependent reductase (Old Yellow Enzyme family)